MPILVTCGNCMQQSQVPDQYAGKKIRCKSCSTVMVVLSPGQQNAPLGPAAALPPAAPLPTAAPGAPLGQPQRQRKKPSMSFKVPLIAALALLILGVCGAGTFFLVQTFFFPGVEAVVVRSISATNSLADTLENVTDHDSAKSYKSKIERHLNRLVALRERQVELFDGEELPREQREEIESEYRDDLESAAKRMRTQMQRIQQDRLVAQELQPVFEEFGQKMLKISSEAAKKQLDAFVEKTKGTNRNTPSRPVTTRAPISQGRPPLGQGPPSRGFGRFQPPRAATGGQVRESIASRWGADRIVVLEISIPSKQSEVFRRVQEIQRQLQNGKREQSSRGSGATIAIGPVDDFNQFVQQIDFGTVTSSDENSRTVKVNVDAGYRFKPR